MPLQLFTIARNTFVESIRQPIFFVLVILSGVMQWLNTWGTGFSMASSTTTSEVVGDNKLLLDIGLATVFVCGMVLAAFAATAVVSREIENKTVLTVVSKPIGRPILILGKYLGVASAILLATLIMLLFLLMAIRHGVMSIASDRLDGPVFAFTFGAVGLALALAIVTNYLYGWPFSQTCILTMAPALALGYFLVLLISKQWHWQPLATDFKPQVALTCTAVVMALLVITALATAVSTRLGQVMTIVVCAGAFVFGLMSNHFIGRHAFNNEWIGIIHRADADHPQERDFRRPGDSYHLTFENEPNVALPAGTPFFWGSSPNGSMLAVLPFVPPSQETLNSGALLDERTAPAVIVTRVEGRVVTIRAIGSGPPPAVRPPLPGDYAFIRPTSVNPLAMTLWAIVPNMHYFWLIDAVTQNAPVPLSHLMLIGLYGLSQIGAFLALGVLLFQRRDVG